MYCEKCGNEINNSKFCSSCGHEAKVNIKDKETKTNKENSDIKDKAYVFVKSKWLGLILLCTIKTNIDIKVDRLYIEQQKKTLGLFNGKKKATSIKITDIQAITTKKAIDLFDGIYAIIFGILGFVAPPLFLVSLACLWTGYGQRIILEHNGMKSKIHTSAKCKTGEFIEYINKYR